MGITVVPGAGTGGGAGEVPGPGSESRAGRAGALRRWCEQCAIPWPAADVSDMAAILIAAGRADVDMRRVLVARAEAGVGIPRVGGYTRLRRDAERLRRWDAAATAAGRTRSWAYAGRTEPLRRRLQGARSGVVSSLVVYPGGVRGVRRERREGIHLTREQRERLFTLLCWTPAPLDGARGRAAGMGAEAVSGFAGAVSQRVSAARQGRPDEGGARVPSALDRPLERVEQWARTAGAPAPAAMRFAHAYETAVYLAARYFDGIRGSATWNSPEFAVHRGRIDPMDELVRFAADASELRSLGAALGAARRARGAGGSAGMDTRTRALGAVWDQLIERLVSLDRIADAMAHLDEALRERAEARRVSVLDDRIDDLVGRSSGHELVTRELHRIGEDLGDDTTGDWALLGYRSSVEREIEELTARERRAAGEPGDTDVGQAGFRRGRPGGSGH